MVFLLFDSQLFNVVEERKTFIVTITWQIRTKIYIILCFFPELVTYSSSNCMFDISWTICLKLTIEQYKYNNFSLLLFDKINLVWDKDCVVLCSIVTIYTYFFMYNISPPQWLWLYHQIGWKACYCEYFLIWTNNFNLTIILSSY